MAITAQTQGQRTRPRNNDNMKYIIGHNAIPECIENRWHTVIVRAHITWLKNGIAGECVGYHIKCTTHLHTYVNIYEVSSSRHCEWTLCTTKMNSESSKLAPVVFSQQWVQWAEMPYRCICYFCIAQRAAEHSSSTIAYVRRRSPIASARLGRRAHTMKRGLPLLFQKYNNNPVLELQQKHAQIEATLIHV